MGAGRIFFGPPRRRHLPTCRSLKIQSGQTSGPLDARADGPAPVQSHVRGLPCDDGSAGAVAGELRRDRPIVRGVDASFRPIDASGVLPDGTAFDQAAEHRQSLLRSPDQFITTLAEKLLTYALGRVHRVLRRPSAACDSSRRRTRRRSLLVAGCWPSCQQHAVSDEQIAIMIITKRALPRRTVLRGTVAAVYVAEA